MLTFTTPLLLAGGLLVAVPILLHLVMRQQPKHLEFPALRFIQQRKESNRRRLLLRHIVLLALRCLAILLLALTLARPKITSSSFLPGGDEPLAAALVFDTSPRMEYRHENATRLEQAREFAFELLPQLPRESQLVVLDSTARRSDFDVDAGAARLRIERLRPTTNNRPLAEMIDNAVQLVESSDLPRKEIFLFTDLSEAQWSPAALAAWNSRAATYPNIAFHVIDVGVEAPVNYALDDVKLSDEVISRNSSLGVETSITSTGGGGNRTVKMYLLNDAGAPRLEGEALVELAADQSEFVEFRLGGLDLGVHHGYVQIEGEDGLPADDRRYFTLNVAAPWRVLLVSPDPVDYYGGIIQYALAPPELRQKGIARFECELVEQSKLMAMPLDVYDAVWLVDPKPLSQQAWQRLAGFTAGGGGLAVILGGNASKLGLIDESFNNSSAGELLPGPIT
ncbi:MAG: VWA domain-containing protein, partial [Pirellulales bacterium]